MRRALLAMCLLTSCTQATPGFESVTPPPVPTLGAIAPNATPRGGASAIPLPSFAFPSFSLSFPPTPAPTRTTRYVHAVWSQEVTAEGLRYDLLFVGFAAGTKATLRAMSSVTTGPLPSPNLSVDITGSPFRISRTIKSSADTFVMTWRIGAEDHVVPLVVNKAMAAWIAGTATPPLANCSTGPITLTFDPPRIRNFANAKLVATGLCAGTLIHAARHESPDGRITITSGNLSVVNYPETPIYISGNLAPGRYVPYYWINGKEYAVPIEVYQ